MIVVIQCAGSKQPNAGRMKTTDGKPVIFVAQPELAPVNGPSALARPDDVSDRGVPWRQVLLNYNTERQNPFCLMPAYQLYRNAIYRRLVKHFGLKNVYILSAGWGLISADFLTPYYDITFSRVKGQKFKCRQKSDSYQDFSMLPQNEDRPVIFFGSKEYVPLFCSLTTGTKSVRTVFHYSENPPEAPGCLLKRFEGKRSTNWQYDCANHFLDEASVAGFRE
jgi:hypothetical protein